MVYLEVNLGSTIENWGNRDFQRGEKTSNVYFTLATILGNMDSEPRGASEQPCGMLLRGSGRARELPTDSHPCWLTDASGVHFWAMPVVWLIAFPGTREISAVEKWSDMAELALGVALTMWCIETRWAQGMGRNVEQCLLRKLWNSWKQKWDKLSIHTPCLNLLCICLVKQARPKGFRLYCFVCKAIWNRQNYEDGKQISYLLDVVKVGIDFKGASQWNVFGVMKRFFMILW